MAQTNIKKYEEGKPKENKISFSHNWNSLSYGCGKLNSRFFTTIRKPDVYPYYEQRIGEMFDVLLEGSLFSRAILKDATLTSLGKITPELLVLDTGTTDYKILFQKFHVIDQCVLLLFENVEGRGK